MNRHHRPRPATLGTVQINLEDSVYVSAPARDIEYVSAPALGWPVKPDKAEAAGENGLLGFEMPFKDPMEDAVKIAVRSPGVEAAAKTIDAGVKVAVEAA